MEKAYWVYILTNKYHTVFCVGVTNDLIRRAWEHKQKVVRGFPYKYHLTKLVYYEKFTDVLEAIPREKYIKGKRRSYKIELIKETNPKYSDLYQSIL